MTRRALPPEIPASIQSCIDAAMSLVNHLEQDLACRHSRPCPPAVRLERRLISASYDRTAVK